jgi:hypothetical protein
MTSPQNESEGPAYNTNAFDAISVSRPSEGLRRVADLFDAVQKEGLSDGLIVQRTVGDVSGFGRQIAAVANAAICHDIICSWSMCFFMLLAHVLCP